MNPHIARRQAREARTGKTMAEMSTSIANYIQVLERITPAMMPDPRFGMAAIGAYVANCLAASGIDPVAWTDGVVKQVDTIRRAKSPIVRPDGSEEQRPVTLEDVSAMTDTVPAGGTPHPDPEILADGSPVE